MHLTCPNCGGLLRTNERSGVVDERCVNCQWVFVGQVELEALLAVKAQFEHARALDAVGAPLYEALASGADYRAHDDTGAQEAVGAPLYDTLASAVDYRREYRSERGRPLSRPNLRLVPSLPPEPPPTRPPDRDTDPVGLRRRHAGPEPWYEQPPPRPQPRYEQPPPRPQPRYEQPPPRPHSWFEQPAPQRQSWYEQPAARPEPAGPLRRGRHRHEWSALEVFD